MNEEQEAMMQSAFAALQTVGVTEEEVDAILSEELLVDVRVGLTQNSEKLATLVTLIGAAAKVELNELLYGMVDLVFLAGWNSAKLAREEVH